MMHSSKGNCEILKEYSQHKFEILNTNRIHTNYKIEN